MDVHALDASLSAEPPPPSAPRSSTLPRDLAVGNVVGEKYELVRKLGHGAMGEVWVARHKTLDEEIAIKLVARNVEHEDGTSSESRFLLEARVAASLSRKTRHIVAVTDHGHEDALGYLVMELLEGESLDARIARTGPQTVAEIMATIAQIARGLAVAHGEGVVHRDLKPSNVFVTRDEDGASVAKILDFGIAKLRHRLDRSAGRATLRGFLLGTPAYMSPEQARGHAVDHRADVWALAVIAYHMLTGEFPFDGATQEELFTRLARIEPIAIRDRRPELAPVVGDFFARAFSRRIEDRFQSAVALANAFEMLDPLAVVAPLEPMDAPVADFCLAVETQRSARDDDSLVVAGLPARRRWLAVLAVLLVSGVVVLTGAALGLYFEHEPAHPHAAELTAVVTRSAPLSTIPAPEAVIETPTEIVSVPIISPDERRPSREMLPAVPSRPRAAAAPSATVARSVDKSEVF
jgi:serine/threonine-protein kinase